MGHNFVGGSRSQLYLLPPSVEDWLPEGHLARFVVEVVDELDVGGFVDAYRDDGRGGAAYDPALMVAVLIYAYCVGERSSRRIEWRLVEDVAFRVVAANVTPDHATIARFRVRHEAAIEELFTQVLQMCRLAGLLTAGVVALDGTKIEAAASMQANRDDQGVERASRREVRRILAEAAAVDAAEDAKFGDARGDELPPELADRSQRLARIRAAKARLDAMNAGGGGEPAGEAETPPGDAGEAEPEGDDADGADDVSAQASTGGCHRRSRAKPRVNLTDPDSRMLKRRGGFCQGFNAQAAVNQNQIIIAAKVVDGHDSEVFEEMVELTKHNLVVVAATCPIEALVADAGYYSRANATLQAGVPVLIATRAGHRQSQPSNTPDPDATTDEAVDVDVDVVDPVEAAMRAEAELTRRRARVLQRITDGELTIAAAGRELGLCWKTTRDLLERFKAGGAAAIVRKHRRGGEGPNPASDAAIVRRTRALMNARVTHPAGRARYKKRSCTAGGSLVNAK